ncbi:single-stranded-DNA-specific exonuclease RecJ [Candidatus Nomurabacteria bacterium]|nr:single-stranded-DNA-specific exonuclease RecJ [Candidatus Nomurabacteria bacterium]
MQPSSLLNELLEKRGITTAEQKEIFLNPNYERDMHDPFLMRDMEKACVRIFEAMEAGEKILVYADYDCDGIPGAVILNDFFNKLNYKNFEVYIPQRNSEGYGLNLEMVKKMDADGVKLLITIDLGITAVAEVAQAIVYGIDVIITDHHIPHAELPRAYAILNPKVDEYSEKMLCGSGVVFKLVQGFLKKYGGAGIVFPLPAELATLRQSSATENTIPAPLSWEKWLLDMAGLATLSDMVPLLGENRVIAYFGLKVFRKSPRPGLQKLLAKMSIDQKYISEDDIGFMVTPRLNAASRMDDPRRAFELLATQDETEAGILANHLTKINDERKKMVAGIMKDVNKKFEKREMNEVIVIGHPEWKVGVLGLVAGKICDEHKKPVFVWGKDENDFIKGSCRSDGSVSVVELMTETREYFLEFGGHEGAGGFTVHTEKVHFLEEALSSSFVNIRAKSAGDIFSLPAELATLRQSSATEKQSPTLFDLKLSLTDVNMKNWKEIEKMAPFGCENPKPIFLFENVKIEKLKKFGKNNSQEHLEIIFSDNNKKATAISFFSGLDSFKIPLAEGLSVNLLATFDLSRFRGREELRLRIVDIM